jgi:hypothetical protein
MSASHNDERAAERKAREHLSRLEDALSGGVDASVPPDDTEIAAYVDGTLDEVSREIFETRLADDPALRAEVQDLRALRSALKAGPKKRSGAVWLPGPWLGAAAALVLVAGAATLWLLGARSPEIRLNDVVGPVVVRRNGAVEGLGSLPADLRQLVGESLRSSRLPLPRRLDRLRFEERALMGDADRRVFRVTTPVGTFVRTDRPTFKWLPLAGASGYRVSVHDENLGLVVASAALNATEWTPTVPLPRSAVLLWQVEAATPDGRVLAPSPSDPQARFEVVSAAEQQALEARLSAAGTAHVSRIVIFAEAGLIDETRAAIEALKVQNPDAAVLDALLGSLDRLTSTP